MAHVFNNLKSTCEILLLTMMILLKGTRFTYTPESICHLQNKEGVSFILSFLFFVFNHIPIPKYKQLLSIQGILFFAFVL